MTTHLLIDFDKALSVPDITQANAGKTKFENSWRGAQGFVWNSEAVDRINALLPRVDQVKHLSNESKDAAKAMSLSDFRSSGLRIPTDSTLFDEILRYVESTDPDDDRFVVVSSEFTQDDVPHDVFEDIDIHFISVDPEIGITIHHVEDLEELI